MKADQLAHLPAAADSIIAVINRRLDLDKMKTSSTPYTQLLDVLLDVSVGGWEGRQVAAWQGPGDS